MSKEQQNKYPDGVTSIALRPLPKKKKIVFRKLKVPENKVTGITVLVLALACTVLFSGMAMAFNSPVLPIEGQKIPADPNPEINTSDENWESPDKTVPESSSISGQSSHSYHI